MKKLSKALLGLIAAVAMLFTGLATGTAAVADTGGQTNNTYSITINNGTEGYTYEAYQVFKGDLSGGTLSNIQWGDGVDGNALLTALQADETLKDTFKGAENAADVAAKLSSDNVQKFAEIVSKHVTTSNQGEAKEPTDDKYIISGLAAGYYLVKNTKVPTGVDAAYSKLIIKVTDDVATDPKMDKPKVTKKVKDVNDSTGVSGWQDTADHDIDDWIDYKLDGTLPADYDAYDTYSYTFTDTLSEGLTYNGSDESHKAKVYVVNKGDDGQEVETAINGGYTVSAVEKDTNLTNEYKNGTTLTVAFADLKSATVDGGVKITKDSIIRVRYQAQLNDHAKVGSTGNPNEVTLTYSNNPTKKGTGTTAPDKVTVFTFTLNVNKYIDANPHTKAGAKFTLWKFKDGQWTEVKKYDKGEETTFEFKGLDDGRYKLVEDAAPAGYNRMADLYFTVAATHTVKQETDGDGKLKLKSLTITVTDASGTELTGADIQQFTTDMTSTTVNISTDIINHKGSTLPSTGGMGTVILYAAGGVCLLAAGLWFGLRRRTAR